MKTIEERAIDVCDNIPYDVYIHSSVNCEDAFKDGYIQGATEQREIDDDHLREATKMLIDKSCEWLKMNLHKDLSIGTWEDDEQSIIEGFRKSMEE